LFAPFQEGLGTEREPPLEANDGWIADGSFFLRGWRRLEFVGLKAAERVYYVGFFRCDQYHPQLSLRAAGSGIVLKGFDVLDQV
jgi:hypothetical protein